MSLILPASAARDELEKRLNYRQHAWADVERDLKQLDDRLSIVYWGERELVTEPGVIPGRFHVVRDNYPFRPHYEPILGPNGSYREPDSGVVEQWRRMDLQNCRVTKDTRQQRERAERSRERAKETARERRVDEIALNIKALDSPGVLYSDARWTNKAGAKRG